MAKVIPPIVVDVKVSAEVPSDVFAMTFPCPSCHAGTCRHQKAEVEMSAGQKTKGTITLKCDNEECWDQFTASFVGEKWVTPWFVSQVRPAISF